MNIFQINVLKHETIFGLGAVRHGPEIVFSVLEHLARPLLPKTRRPHQDAQKKQQPGLPHHDN
jgi:hypothetical protein